MLLSIFCQIFKHKDTFFHGIGKKVSLLKIPRITIHGGNIDLPQPTVYFNLTD